MTLISQYFLPYYKAGVWYFHFVPVIIGILLVIYYKRNIIIPIFFGIIGYIYIIIINILVYIGVLKKYGEEINYDLAIRYIFINATFKLGFFYTVAFFVSILFIIFTIILNRSKYIPQKSYILLSKFVAYFVLVLWIFNGAILSIFQSS